MYSSAVLFCEFSRRLRCEATHSAALRKSGPSAPVAKGAIAATECRSYQPTRAGGNT